MPAGDDGVRADGRKELIALAAGYRESTESWEDLLRDCARRGMRARCWPSAMASTPAASDRGLRNLDDMYAPSLPLLEHCLKPVDRPGGVYLPGDHVEVLKQ